MDVVRRRYLPFAVIIPLADLDSPCRTAIGRLLPWADAMIRRRASRVRLPRLHMSGAHIVARRAGFAAGADLKVGLYSYGRRVGPSGPPRIENAYPR